MHPRWYLDTLLARHRELMRSGLTLAEQEELRSIEARIPPGPEEMRVRRLLGLPGRGVTLDNARLVWGVGRSASEGVGGRGVGKDGGRFRKGRVMRRRPAVNSAGFDYPVWVWYAHGGVFSCRNAPRVFRGAHTRGVWARSDRDGIDWTAST